MDRLQAGLAGKGQTAYLKCNLWRERSGREEVCHHADTLKKRTAIIQKVKSKYWQRTHKYGIKVPKTMAEAKIIDSENKNTTNSLTLLRVTYFTISQFSSNELLHQRQYM